ncbi:MAG: DinB family protein [Actinobacteria bacterium]|nr:DinB family protein [Actinomycetota bacterium]
MVETWWFHQVFAGRPAPAPFASADRDSDENSDWTSALADPPDELRQLYRDAITRSDAIISEADLDDVAQASSGFAGKPTLHWILLHVTTETARHAGHADLIREAIDGATGWWSHGDV